MVNSELPNNPLVDPMTGEIVKPRTEDNERSCPSRSSNVHFAVPLNPRFDEICENEGIEVPGHDSLPFSVGQGGYIQSMLPNDCSIDPMSGELIGDKSASHDGAVDTDAISVDEKAVEMCKKGLDTPYESLISPTPTVSTLNIELNPSYPYTASTSASLVRPVRPLSAIGREPTPAVSGAKDVQERKVSGSSNCTSGSSSYSSFHDDRGEDANISNEQLASRGSEKTNEDDTPNGFSQREDIQKFEGFPGQHGFTKDGGEECFNYQNPLLRQRGGEAPVEVMEVHAENLHPPMHLSNSFVGGFAVEGFYHPGHGFAPDGKQSFSTDQPSAPTRVMQPPAIPIKNERRSQPPPPQPKPLYPFEVMKNHGQKGFRQQSYHAPRPAPPQQPQQQSQQQQMRMMAPRSAPSMPVPAPAQKNFLANVKDINSRLLANDFISPGKLVRVKYSYEPRHSDEFRLDYGEVYVVLVIAADSWALCSKVGEALDYVADRPELAKHESRPPVNDSGKNGKHDLHPHKPKLYTNSSYRCKECRTIHWSCVHSQTRTSIHATHEVSSYRGHGACSIVRLEVYCA